MIRGLFVAVGSILAVEEDENGGYHLENGGENEGHAPRDGAWGEFGDGRVEKRHNELGNTCADVSPTGRDAVSETNDVAGEHGRHPVLISYEISEREADEETDEDEGSRRGDECGGEDGGSGEEREDRRGSPWSDEITEWTHGEAGEDRASEGGDSGGGYGGVGEAEVGGDDGDERRDREGGEEA